MEQSQVFPKKVAEGPAVQDEVTDVVLFPGISMEELERQACEALVEGDRFEKLGFVDVISWVRHRVWFGRPPRPPRCFGR